MKPALVISIIALWVAIWSTRYSTERQFATAGIQIADLQERTEAIAVQVEQAAKATPNPLPVATPVPGTPTPATPAPIITPAPATPAFKAKGTSLDRGPFDKKTGVATTPYFYKVIPR